jgi:hypothetical protein
MSAPHSTIAMMVLLYLVRAAVCCPVSQMWYTIPAVIGKSGIISGAHLDNAKTQKVCEKMVAFLGASKATVIEAVDNELKKSMHIKMHVLSSCMYRPKVIL